MPTIPMLTKMTDRMHSALSSMPATLPESIVDDGGVNRRRARCAGAHGHRNAGG
jgi:hypothetical protein